MRNWKAIAITGALLVRAAAAQSITPPFPVALEKELAGRASKYTEVSLDKKMLAFAAKFMNEKEEDAETKRLIEKLDGIYVREYSFDKPGQYTATDLERIRNQFNGSEWSPIVREHSKTGEDTGVYVKLVDGRIRGVFVLDAEKNVLDLVYVAGPLDAAEITKLGGSFGIPKNVATLAGVRSAK